MAHFEVVQRLAAVSTIYDVREPGKEEVLLIARGASMALTPKFALMDANEKVIASLEGNFNKTEFHVLDAERKEIASVTFPSVALKKTLALKVGDRSYTADAGVLALEYDFKCADDKGVVAIEVKKRIMNVRDQFTIETGEGIPREVGVLITVAIHSRYFEVV